MKVMVDTSVWSLSLIGRSEFVRRFNSNFEVV